MKIFASAAVAIAGIMAMPAAMAWGAIATHNGTHSYIATGYFTEADAVKFAMTLCEEKRGNGCKNQAAVNGGVLVVASGDGGQSFATGTDPVEVRGLALEDCQKHYGRCKIVNAEWDAGVFWAAFSVGDKNFQYASEYSTPEGAIKAATSRCEERNGGKGTCRLSGGSARSGAEFFAQAVSMRADLSTAAVESTQDQADKSALKACREKSEKAIDCKVVKRADNPSSKAAPASFKALKKEATANLEALDAPKR